MTGTQKQMIYTQPIPSRGWFLRWAKAVIYLFACAGYLSNLLSLQRFTLISFLLLTGTYGAWLVIFALGELRFGGRTNPGWLLAMFCLACAAQFLPWPGSTDFFWRPLLSTITACQMTGLRPRLLGLVAIGCLWLSSSLSFALLGQHWYDNQLVLLLSFFCFCGLMAAIRELAVAYTALEESNAELAAAHARLQEYSAQVEELSVVRERNRIAREIHDTLGHSLTLLAVQLETATQHEMRGDPRLREELLEARQVAKACLMDVRHSVEALRPEEASGDSLREQLHRLVAACEATSREPHITLDLEEATTTLHPEVCLTLYRCTQEALTNIRKHANATKVLLRLSTNDEQVELTVLDNGHGDLPGHEHSASGFGLRGMRERVESLRGTLRAGPEPRHGWRVEVMIPLKPQGQVALLSPTCARETREKA